MAHQGDAEAFDADPSLRLLLFSAKHPKALQSMVSQHQARHELLAGPEARRPKPPGILRDRWTGRLDAGCLAPLGFPRAVEARLRL